MLAKRTAAPDKLTQQEGIKDSALLASAQSQLQVALPQDTVSAKNADNALTAAEPAPDPLVVEKLSRAVGTCDQHLVLSLINQACTSSPRRNDESSTGQLQRVLPAIQGVAPRDEVEGMLAVQIVSLHNVAMDHLRRAALPEQHPGRRDKYVNNATKLTRAFGQAVETLNRYRGKGEQKVTVEHVHVNSGGQAIVGSVGAPEGRGNQG